MKACLLLCFGRLLVSPSHKSLVLLKESVHIADIVWGMANPAFRTPMNSFKWLKEWPFFIHKGSSFVVNGLSLCIAMH